MTFKEVRKDIEIIFERYRKHKYYTLFKDTYSINVTSQIDDVGGGKSNQTSDKVADAAIKAADEKAEAEKYVFVVEQAVDQLPDVEKEVVELRYMSKNHDYINDYTVYELNAKQQMSPNTYRKIRGRAFVNLYNMLINDSIMQKY